MTRAVLFLSLLLCSEMIFAQGAFNYRIALVPITIGGLPGLHSYAFAKHNDKWLLIGGRKDGIHARQPNSSFPQSQNNTDIYVVDVNTKQYWTASVTTLPVAIAEQMQATNMNFIQVEDTLCLIGGYAYSATAANHITFDKLTTIDVPGVINAVISGTAINSYFRQASDTAFAVTGGQLGKTGDYFHLVGGHKFTGRYNPMGNPTYTQVYTNQVRKFKINNSGSHPSISDYSTITDAIHLRRRDYNLLPQIFAGGTAGYTIFSGVFQLGADLPFLYPVDVTASGITPHTGFNQYLSHYHCAKIALFDSVSQTMHSLFLGGMSQYYYASGVLTKDDDVPFVKTISRVSRSASGVLKEYLMNTEMPAFAGASAEFISNDNVAHYETDIIKLHRITSDTTIAGYVYGGIISPSLHPFVNNQTNTTAAGSTIYAVLLIKDNSASAEHVNDNKKYSINIYPNPTKGKLFVQVKGNGVGKLQYYISNISGQVLQAGLGNKQSNSGNFSISIDKNIAPQQLSLTTVVDDVHYNSVLIEYRQ